MLSYEEFKEIVMQKFMEYMPEEYQHYDLETRHVNKVNREMDGIIIRIPGNITPALYINQMYKTYTEEGNLEAVFQTAARMMVKGFENPPEFNIKDKITNDNIVMKLVNTDMNRGMLANCPHREVMDLSVIYGWVVQVSEDGISTAQVTNTNADSYGLTEKELYELAMENMKHLFPYKVESMDKVMMSLFDMEEANLGFVPSAPDGMYIISNAQGINGAVAMLDDELMHGLAMHMGKDLHVLPSSVHESATSFAA